MKMIPEFVRTGVDESFTPVTVDDFNLFLGQIVGADLAEAFQIDKQLVRVDEIEVDIIEIVEQHLAPENELVKVDHIVAQLAVFIV